MNVSGFFIEQRILLIVFSFSLLIKLFCKTATGELQPDKAASPQASCCSKEASYASKRATESSLRTLYASLLVRMFPKKHRRMKNVFRMMFFIYP
jgi:hypothetical protein